MDTAMLRRLAPFGLLVAIPAAAWLLVIGPATSVRARLLDEEESLRVRRAALQRSLAAPLPDAVAGLEPAVLDDLVSPDAMPVLLQQLTQIARAAGARNLHIETTGAPEPVGERFSIAGPPDPRLAAFGPPLGVVTVGVSFEGNDETAVDILRALGDVQALVGIGALEIARPGAAGNGALAAGPATRDGPFSVSLTLLVYTRSISASPAAPRDGSAG